MDGIEKNPHAAGRMERGNTHRKSSQTPPPGSGAAALDGRPRELRNTCWIIVYQLLVRVGWLFKTETVIMPAVLDAAAARACRRFCSPGRSRGCGESGRSPS